MAIQIVLVIVSLSMVSGQGLHPGVGNACFFPKAVGNCRAFFASFYYNPAIGACDCFVYSGCDGNPNRFSSLENCMAECNVSPDLQVISTECRNIFEGTDLLEDMLDKFDSADVLANNIIGGALPPPSMFAPALSPTTEQRLQKLTFPSTFEQASRQTFFSPRETFTEPTQPPRPATSEQTTPRPTAERTTKSLSDLAASFFQPAKHFWLDD